MRNDDGLYGGGKVKNERRGWRQWPRALLKKKEAVSKTISRARVAHAELGGRRRNGEGQVLRPGRMRFLAVCAPLRLHTTWPQRADGEQGKALPGAIIIVW